jgi:hypothetical protein
MPPPPPRLAETRSMRLEIAALEAQSDDTSVVRGAGVCGGPGDQNTPVPLFPLHKRRPAPPH